MWGHEVLERFLYGYALQIQTLRLRVRLDFSFNTDL